MFSHNYFEKHGFGNEAGLARLSLIADLTLYLTACQESTYAGRNTKNRAFLGAEKMKAAAVYQARIKHGAKLWR
jgi:hypothetical protein